MSAFTTPSFTEILRASQKDDLVKNQMANDISTNVLLKILGPRLWIHWKPWIEASIHFTYFAITTLADLQTIGEEYTGILQVTNVAERLKIPSRFSRLVMICLETFGPLILKQCSKSWLKHPKTDQFIEIFDYISKFHILWFYIEENFYQIPKRFVSVEYVKLRPWGGLPQNSPIKNWLKLLSIFNGVVLILQLINKYKSQAKIQINSQTKNITETKGRKCPLCLEPRKNPTSTLCGHIFCWDCIQESAQIKSECPICRDEVLPSKLIPIMNLD